MARAQIDAVWTGSRLELDRAEFRRLCAALPIGPVIVTAQVPKSQRSLDQNAYLHAVPFPILAKELGCSIPEVKRDLMGACWGWKVSPITGKDVPLREHTAEMTVEDCTFFIDWLLPWAAEFLGMRLPLPDERSVA